MKLMSHAIQGSAIEVCQSATQSEKVRYLAGISAISLLGTFEDQPDTK